MEEKDFKAVFLQLKAVLQPYEALLLTKENTSGSLYLEGPFSEKYGKPMFFSAIKINKNYVSYHLMPVYVCPDLLDGISPALKRRMQGKACFNFRTLAETEPLLGELTTLTEQGYQRFKSSTLI